MWAGCCMPGIWYILVNIAVFFNLSGETESWDARFKDSFRKAENKIPFEFWYSLWFLRPKPKLSHFSCSFLCRFREHLEFHQMLEYPNTPEINVPQQLREAGLYCLLSGGREAEADGEAVY